MTNSLQTAPKDCSTFAVPSGYEFIEKLGEGAYGIVIKARRQSIDDVVAIKLLKDPDERTSKRFRAEAALVGRLRHENIARVLLLGESEDGGLYIVYEFIEGETLKARLEREPLSHVEFFSVFRQLLSALACAHTSGLIHRDIKPSNIMLCKDDSGELCTKLLDFGIAKNTLDMNTSLTQTNEVVGTPEYMSPEQCLSLPLDQRSDLYSLACVMFECLCSEAPLRGDNPMHSLYRKINDRPPSLKNKLMQEPIPECLAALVDSALQKQPELRPADADEFLAKLQQSEHSTTRTASILCGRKNLWCAVAAVCALLLPLIAFRMVGTAGKPTEAPLFKPQAVHLTRSKLASPEQCLRAIAKNRADLWRPTDLNVAPTRDQLIKELVALEKKFDKGPRAGNSLLCGASLLHATMLRENMRSAEAVVPAVVALECCLIDGKYANRAVDALFNIASAKIEQNDKQGALVVIEQALTLAENSDQGPVIELPSSLHLLCKQGTVGKLYTWRAELTMLANPNSAEKDLLHARETLKAIHVDAWRVDVETSLAKLYLVQGRRAESIRTAELIHNELDEALSTGKVALGNAYKNLGFFWIEVNEPKRAVNAWEKALDQLSSAKSDSRDRSLVLHQLESAYTRCGGHSFKVRKMHELALRHQRFPELHGV